MEVRDTPLSFCLVGSFVLPFPPPAHRGHPQTPRRMHTCSLQRLKPLGPAALRPRTGRQTPAGQCRRPRCELGRQWRLAGGRQRRLRQRPVAGGAATRMRRNGPILTRGNPIISSAFCQNSFHFSKFIALVCFVLDGFLSDVAFLNFVGFLSWDEEP